MDRRLGETVGAIELWGVWYCSVGGREKEQYGKCNYSDKDRKKMIEHIENEHKEYVNKGYYARGKKTLWLL